jgi:hypothetical protein
MHQLTSVEEAISLLGALIVAAICYFVFHRFLVHPGLVAVLIGFAFAIALALVTSSQLNLMADAVTFRNLFRSRKIVLAHVKGASVQTFWRGLPGQTIMIRMKRPPSEVNGYFFRVGIFAWPSARRWVDEVNTAVRDLPSKPE